MARRRTSLWGAFDALTRQVVRNSLRAARPGKASPATKAATVIANAATKAAGKRLRAAGNAAIRAGQQAGRQITRDAARHSVAQLTKTTRQVLTGVVSPVKALPSAGTGRWLEGHWGVGPMALRKYRLFVPDGVTQDTPAPMLILLHGCGQDSASIAASTRAAALARGQRFIVLLPEQSSQANPQRCWNWFRGQAQVALEATIIMAITDHVCRSQPVRGDALFAIGISAGGTMALTLALHYPQRLRAVGAHSCAVPHSATSTVQAGQAMRGRIDPDTAGLRQSLAGRQLPPLILFHGDRDYVVSPDNAIATVALWLELRPEVALGADLLQSQPIHALRRGSRRPALINDWPERAAPRRPYVRLVRIEGLGHAWSGGSASQAFSDPKGPDALKMAWQFFLRGLV